MNLSARERRLVIVLGAVLSVMVVVFLLGRLGGGSAAEVPDLVLPTASQTAVPMPPPTGSPTFVIPVGARDPFKA